MSVKLLTENILEFLCLKGGCTGSSKSTHVKMPHCWKSPVMAQLCESSSRCGFSLLQVIDGGLRERYCGSDAPSMRTYSKEYVRVLFHLDSMNNNSSFKLVYADIGNVPDT